MIVAIHQPHFLPWLGYLDRMKRADVFLVLDHVQYERQNYQNRVMIKTGDRAQWVVVPLFNRTRSERIVDKVIDNQRAGRGHWARKLLLTLERSYRGTPYFNTYRPELERILQQRWYKLIDLNLALMEWLREVFEIDTPIIRTSELNGEGQKSDLVLNLCKLVGAETFLGGLGGSRTYLDEDAFRDAGISVQWQNFVHPYYAQRPQPQNFIRGLSAVDALFNCGPLAAQLLAMKESAHAA